METPESFWAADTGSAWVRCADRKAALRESSQYLRRPHAMRMRRMKLSELLSKRQNRILDSQVLLERLAESDDDVEWTFGQDSNPLGEDLDDDDFSFIVEAGLRAMMEEADKWQLEVDGCVVLEHVYLDE